MKRFCLELGTCPSLFGSGDLSVFTQDITWHLSVFTKGMIRHLSVLSWDSSLKLSVFTLALT